MDQRFLPKTFDGKLDHVMEEAAEVTKAILKARRFGLIPHDFEGVHYDNRADLIDELRDLQTAVVRAVIALDAL